MENINKSDILQDINTTTNEGFESYFTDIYTPGETKEQLIIGGEVAKPSIFSGTIDTATISVTTDNIYTLSVANPDGKIFSLGVDGNIKTFKIGYFNDTPLAYTTLETELQTWLGMEYIVEYISGTNYTLSRLDKTTISISRPNLVRKLEIGTWSMYTKIDIIIDGVTYSFDGVTYPTIQSIFTYLYNTLSTTTYFLSNETTYFLIARKDTSIPTITSNVYDRYTYSLAYLYTDTPNSGQYLDYVDTTIDGNTIRGDYTVNSRAYKGYDIVRNITSYNETLSFSNSIVGATALEYGILFTTETSNINNLYVKTIKKDINCTATRAILRELGGSALATITFSGVNATFNYKLNPGIIYEIVLDSVGASYTRTSSSPVSSDFVTINSTTIYNISEIVLGYVGLDLSSYITSNSISETFGTYSYLYLNKSDYSTISISSLNHYTDSITFPDNPFGTVITTNTNQATITVTTYTEITITLTLTSNNYFIPVTIKISKIQMSAISSGGTSEGTYDVTGQSCTAKYGTTTVFVADKIFKTNTSNYGNIVLIKRGGFVINFTTNTSNKLNFTCS